MTEQSYVLVAVETAHIQSYIYASNRLRENVGASYLVAAATGDWAIETLLKMFIRTNLTNDANDPFTNQHIESHDLDVEVIYSGGGNFVALFADDAFTQDELTGEMLLLPESIARQFIRRLSRRIQCEAPGLKLTFSAMPFYWQHSLSMAVGNLLESMKQQRSYQPASYGDAGQAVQIMCASTSMPAVTMDKETRSRTAINNPWQPYSAETMAKREAFSIAHDVLDETINISTDHTFALDLDDLGRSEGDTSYIAVIHADGNGLGLLIQGLQSKFPADANYEYINYMRKFSENVKKVAREAQRDMVRRLIASIEIDSKTQKHYIQGVGRKVEAIELTQDQNKKFILPLRPLVSGGDDVTFACDGRIGLDLAATFLEAFEAHTVTELDMPLTACAGVAIVKTHYPFARAYDLADNLAGNAKQARFLIGDDAPSALDWHITAGGLYGDLETMRKREYQIADGSLTLRPLFISDAEPLDYDPHSWTMLQRILTEFQTSWRDSRNKAEGLREVLRQGATETAVFKLRYLSDSKSPRLPKMDGFDEHGWKEINGKRYCGYYDALELLDKYIPLITQIKETTIS